MKFPSAGECSKCFSTSEITPLCRTLNPMPMQQEQQQQFHFSFVFFIIFFDFVCIFLRFIVVFSGFLLIIVFIFTQETNDVSTRDVDTLAGLVGFSCLFVCLFTHQCVCVCLLFACRIYFCLLALFCINFFPFSFVAFYFVIHTHWAL